MPKDDWAKINQGKTIKRATSYDPMHRERVRYVVFVGHVPGVYATWAEAWEQIEGYKGSRHHKYSDPLPAWDAYEAFQKTGEIPNALRKKLEKGYRTKEKKRQRKNRRNRKANQ